MKKTCLMKYVEDTSRSLTEALRRWRLEEWKSYGKKQTNDDVQEVVRTVRLRPDFFGEFVSGYGFDNF